MSDRETTADLMARLERHYLNPNDRLPAGVFLPEVGWNGYDQSSRCDALFVGFTSASGRLLVGHEVKASRSDWLSELRKTGKADSWADQCHQWWLVAVPGVVADGELPAGWGLMVPGARTRMKVVTPAATRDAKPSWDATRSVVARISTLHRNSMTAETTRIRTEVNEQFERQVQAEVNRRTRDLKGADELRALVERYQTAIGGELADSPRAWGNQLTDAELTEAADWIRQRRRATNVGAQLGQAHGLVSVRRQLEAVRDALSRLDELEAGITNVTGALRAG